MAITSAISGRGASSASSASGASQAAGGATSQSSAAASTANKRDSHGNYARTSAESQGKVSYSSSTTSSSSGGNKYAGTVSIGGGNGISGNISIGGGGGSSGGGSSPVVVTAQTNVTPEISEAVRQSGGNYTIRGNNSGNTTTNLPGTQIEVSKSEWDAMHPIKTPENNPLTGKAQIHIATQEKQAEKAAAGNYYGAYVEKVAAKSAHAKIEQATAKTINPYAEKVTLTESLRTDPLIGNAFTAVQTSLFDADGKFDPLPLIGNPEDVTAAYSNRIAGYEAKEGKTGRLEQSASGVLEIATLPLNFVGGFGTGAAIGTAGKGLAKLTSTKVGAAVTNAVTKPWISKKVVLSTAEGMDKVTNKIILTYDKLPKETQNVLDALGRRYASPKAISSIGVGIGAGLLGIDSTSAAVAKNTVVDTIFKRAAQVSQNSKINTAYNIYAAPLLSKGNLLRVDKAVGDTAANTVISTINFGMKHPTAYKVITAGKNAVATPGALAMNTLQGAYLVDAGYRVATSDDKLKTAAQVALEIPVGFVGAKYGLQAIDKASSYLTTRGRQYIPIEKIGYAEGIPLGKGMTDSTLEASFDLNTPIPKPYRFGRTANQNQPTPTEARVKPTANYDPYSGVDLNKAFPNQVWHATPQGERLGNKIIVGDSTSELPGIYTSEVGVGYYLHLEQKNNIKPALLITQSNPSYTPKFAVFRVTDVESIPAKGRTMQARYLRENANPTKAYTPNMKEEYEALLPPGANFVRTGKGYYTIIDGNRIPIDEYAPNLDVSIEYLQLRAMDKRYDLNLPTEKRIAATKLYADKNIRDTSKSKFNIYKPSSYSKTSGKQITLGGTSYAGSKAGRSLSIKGSSTKQTPSFAGLFSDISLPSFGKPTSGKGTASGSKSKGGTASSRTPSPSIPISAGTSKPINYIIESPGKGNKREAPLKKKRDDKRGTDIDLYSAARRGRIDHLSIVDPLEFLGKGSMTNRKRADMTLYKQKIYLVDSDISLTKPTGRRRK